MQIETMHILKAIQYCGSHRGVVIHTPTVDSYSRLISFLPARVFLRYNTHKENTCIEIKKGYIVGCSSLQSYAGAGYKIIEMEPAEIERLNIL